MNIVEIEVASLLPHAGELVLLDGLSDVTDTSLVAHTVVRRDGLYNNNQNQVPSFVAVEYMAQAIAAWASYRGREEGLPVKPGLLLGVRDFQADVEYLDVDKPLSISIELIMEMKNGMGVFDGTTRGEDCNISCRLSVLTVESLDALSPESAK